MTCQVFEGKYELDSLAAVLLLSAEYYDKTSDVSIVTDTYVKSIRQIIDVVGIMSQGTDSWEKGEWKKEIKGRRGVGGAGGVGGVGGVGRRQDGTAWWEGERRGSGSRERREVRMGGNGRRNLEARDNVPYYFARMTDLATDTLINQARGPPCNKTGLSASMFRASDDAQIYPYHIPANAMFAVAAERVARLLDKAKQVRLTNNNINNNNRGYRQGNGDDDAKLSSCLDEYSEVRRPTTTPKTPLTALYIEEVILSSLADELRAIAMRIRTAINEHGLLDLKGEKSPFYAYEVDGFGM